METNGVVPTSADVIVVGAGLAGCAATLAAAELGGEVLLLEGEQSTGGSTVLSAGLSAFAGTAEQHRQDIADSVELLREDLLETGRHANDPALVDAYCRDQLEVYHWLAGLGVRYGTVHAAAGQSVPRSHPTNTRTMLDLLLRNARGRGATVVTGARVRRLVSEAGRVTGVDVEHNGRRHTVRAGAVVLATGGFSRNADLLTRFAPRLAEALRAGGAGSRGDGLLMAWKLGAGFVDTPHIKGTYGIYPEPAEGEAGTGVLAVYKGAVAVNAAGRRFVDESLPYKEIGDASLAQPGGVTHQIFDATVMAASDPEVPIYDLRSREHAGLLVRSDTLADLTARLGLPPNSLESTIDRYNASIVDGTPDEFGRRHLSGAVGERIPIATPPFYAHRSGTVVLATYCGLTVTPDCEVLDVFGEPIPGLLAAGEVIGGFHGAGYMTGTSIGKSAVFGRRAGRTATRLTSAVPR